MMELQERKKVKTPNSAYRSTIRFFSTGCILYGASSFMGSMTKERLCMSTWGMHRSLSDITRSS